MKLPKINWIPFDKNNPPSDLCPVEKYLIFFREDNYDDGATWTYNVDYAEPFGDYLDNFWDTENDWDEGQRIEVLAYAEFPYELKEIDLIEEKADIYDNCPHSYKYHLEPEYCVGQSPKCIDCWNREIPENRENAEQKCDDTSEMDKLRMENEIYRKTIEEMKVELTKCNAMFRVIEQFTDTRLPKVKTDF